MWVILNNNEKLLFDDFMVAKDKFYSLISSHMKENPDVYPGGMTIPLGSYFNYMLEGHQPVEDIFNYTNSVFESLLSSGSSKNLIDLKYFDNHEFGKVYIESKEDSFVAGVDNEYISISLSSLNDPYATYRFTSRQTVCTSTNIAELGKKVSCGLILYYDSGVRFNKCSISDIDLYANNINSIMYKKNLGILHITDRRNNAYIGSFDSHLAETVFDHYLNDEHYCKVYDDKMGWIYLENDYFEAMKELFMYSKDSIETYRKWNSYTHFFKNESFYENLLIKEFYILYDK